MEHIDEIAQDMADEGVGGAYPARSVIFDFADNHGHPTFTIIRSVDFLVGGSKITISASSGVADSTTDLGASFLPEFAFYTALSKVGSVSNVSWAPGTGPLRINTRLFFKFNTDISFDDIVINNTHDNGSGTDAGVNNTKIYTTEDEATPSTAYNSAITGGILIYDDVIRAHVALNQEDPETLVLI